MRLIDADKIKEQIADMTIREKLPVTKAIAMLRLIDMQPTSIEGIVSKSKYVYCRTTRIKPIEHHYEEPGEKPYVKYGCPVCEAVRNLHQIALGEENCPLCGVNFSWEN